MCSLSSRTNERVWCSRSSSFIIASISIYKHCCNVVKILQEQSNIPSVANTSKCRKKVQCKEFLACLALNNTEANVRASNDRKNMHRARNARMYHRWCSAIETWQTHRNKWVVLLFGQLWENTGVTQSPYHAPEEKHMPENHVDNRTTCIGQQSLLFWWADVNDKTVQTRRAVCRGHEGREIAWAST